MQNFPILNLSHIRHELGCGFFTITPDIAKTILATRNTKNRTVKPVKLLQLVSDLKQGDFALNGETIIFAHDGSLMDGQHRLKMCEDAGLPFVSLVAFGISADARETLDQGANRTTGDILHMGGVASGNQVAAIAKLVFAWNKSGGAKLSNLNAVSRAQIMKTFEAHPEVADAAHYGAKNKASGIANGTVTGFCYWLLAHVYGVDVADDYMTRILKGSNLSLGEGALAARNRLIAEGKGSNTAKIEIILRGFVYQFTGKTLSKIVVSDSSLLPVLPAPSKRAA